MLIATHHVGEILPRRNGHRHAVEKASDILVQEVTLPCIWCDNEERHVALGKKTRQEVAFRTGNRPSQGQQRTLHCL